MARVDQEPQTIVSWPNLVAFALETQNINSRELFAQAGIAYNQATDPTERVDTKKISILFQLAVSATKDPSFGLSLAQFAHPATFHALGYSLFASDTLLDFCERLVRFFSLISDNASHHLIEQDDAYCLYVIPLNPHVCYESIDGWMGCIVQFCRIISQPGFKPLSVSFIRAEPENGQEKFHNFFRAPVRFSEEKNAIYFEKSLMHEVLPAANAVLARRNDEIVIEYLAQLNKKDIVRQLEASMIELLPKGVCNKDIFAEKLNLTPRTLQNKLEKEGTTYQVILDDLRKTLACQYIRQKNMPISEITYLLGFADTSNFSRAFRGWTGLSPSSYRKNSGADQA